MKYPEKTYTIKASAVRGAKRALGKAAKNKVDFEIGEKNDGTFYFLPIKKESNVVAFKEPVKRQPRKEPINKAAPVKEPVSKEPKVKTVVYTDAKRTYNRGAVAYCWAVFDAMNERRRKDVVDFCVKEGINIHTAKTQYQKWFVSQKTKRLSAFDA